MENRSLDIFHINQRGTCFQFKKPSDLVPFANSHPNPNSSDILKPLHKEKEKENVFQEQFKEWRCLVPEANKIIMKKQFKKITNTKVKKMTQKFTLSHTKRSGQVILNNYLKKKAHQQKINCYLSPKKEDRCKCFTEHPFPRYTHKSVTLCRNIKQNRFSPQKTCTEMNEKDLNLFQEKEKSPQKHREGKIIFGRPRYSVQKRTIPTQKNDIKLLGLRNGKIWCKK